MANKYCNLDVTKKIKDTFLDINTGFASAENDITMLETTFENGIALVETTLKSDIQLVDTRVGNIIENAGDSNLEIVDARLSVEEGVTYTSLGARLNNNDVKLTAINNKIKTYSFTATSTTSNIIHNLEFNPLKDDLLVFYKGILLDYIENYTHNVNNIAITLTDWTIESGEIISFKLYKDVI